MAVVILVVGLILFLAYLSSALFEKTRVPDVLPLLLIGLLVGPIFRVVSVETFGQVGSVMTLVALVIILFESGIRLNFKTVGKNFGRGAEIALLNFLFTMIVAGLAVNLLFGISLLEALMFGSIIGGVSSAVVIPLIGKLKLSDDVKAILTLESGLSDVLCIVVTLALLQALVSNQIDPFGIIGQVIASFVVAMVIGIVAALFWSTVLNKTRHIENGGFITPAFVFVIFGITELLGFSGAIAALTIGVTLGNIHLISFRLSKKFTNLNPIDLSKREKALFGEIVFLLKIFFFIYTGILIQFAELKVMLVGLAVFMFLLIIRFPIVRISMPKSMNQFEAALSSVMIPKGLAAAVLATIPLQVGIASGELIQNLVLSVILFTISGTAVLAFFVEKQRLPSLFAGYAPFVPDEEGRPNGSDAQQRVIPQGEKFPSTQPLQPQQTPSQENVTAISSKSSP